MYTPSPATRVRTAPSPRQARRARRSARWILTSGTLEARDDGLFLQPDAFWTRVFAPEDGWYVARWCDVAVVEVARGGRYSVLRGRLRVLDADGERLFTGEVDLKTAHLMLGRAHPDGEPWRVEPEPGYFGTRRYIATVNSALPGRSRASGSAP